RAAPLTSRFADRFGGNPSAGGGIPPNFVRCRGARSSDEAQLRLRLVGDDPAGRAVPAGLHRRAAGLVAGSLPARVQGRVAGPPVPQQAKRAGEVEALLAEAVGEARRALGVRL